MRILEEAQKSNADRIVISLLLWTFRILRMSDSEAGVKEQKSGGVVRGGEYGDDVVSIYFQSTGIYL